MNSKDQVEFGDFQTPLELAEDVISLIGINDSTSNKNSILSPFTYRKNKQEDR